jgi:galactokinase
MASVDDRPARDRVLEAAGDNVDLVVSAPGRANLVGEHTDYNDGFVLPFALPLATHLAGRRSSRGLKLTSLDEPGRIDVDIESGAGPTTGWGRYATAVVRALLDARIPIAGLEGVVGTDIPLGAGLGSSGALEMAIASAITLDINSLDLADVCRRAENLYVGVHCGVMDQLVSAFSVVGHALLIDCLTIEVEQIPFPRELSVVVVDSALRRSLLSSPYNERRRECFRAAELLSVPTLREASMRDLSQLDAEPVLLRRARHIVSENERVLAVAGALRDGRIDELGRLFEESHNSYARDFEASTPEIDTLVEIAADIRGVVAARLTGGGWGGCTVNLVDTSSADEAATSILHSYKLAIGLTARAWTTRPAAGLSIHRIA